jgi:anti-sigma regulatory factor (Ser/Thr protein kinase)
MPAECGRARARTAAIQSHGMDRQSEGPRVRVFPARRDAFVRVQSFIEETCGGVAVRREDYLRLTLMVEELFTNTVVHGHRGDTDAPVALALDVTGSAIAVEYRDSAPPYDPFAALAAPSESGNVDERPVGGLGVALIVAMADEVRYACRDGENRITFRVRRSG